MTVHAIHIFDRKGKTLFTKRYTPAAAGNKSSQDAEQLAEQRKLIFGMLFSLRELVGTLTPEGQSPSLHSVKTGAGTLHCYETISGIRIALYVNNNPMMNTLGTPAVMARKGESTQQNNTSFQAALKYIYSEIWVECVVRSPLYSSSRWKAHLSLESLISRLLILKAGWTNICNLCLGSKKFDDKILLSLRHYIEAFHAPL
jgi:hypothetical protein